MIAIPVPRPERLMGPQICCHFSWRKHSLHDPRLRRMRPSGTPGRPALGPGQAGLSTPTRFLPPTCSAPENIIPGPGVLLRQAGEDPRAREGWAKRPVATKTPPADRVPKAKDLLRRPRKCFLEAIFKHRLPGAAVGFVEKGELYVAT